MGWAKEKIINIDDIPNWSTISVLDEVWYYEEYIRSIDDTNVLMRGRYVHHHQNEHHTYPIDINGHCEECGKLFAPPEKLDTIIELKKLTSRDVMKQAKALKNVTP